MLLSHPPIQVHGPRCPKPCPEFSLGPGATPSLGSNNRRATSPPTHDCISSTQNSRPLQGTGRPPKEQFRCLQEKSNDTTAFLWKCPLTRSEAWTFYYACYLLSVSYPLSASSLTRQQLDTIQRKAMSIIVPRCGFSRNTKKEILYGPMELGGASFRPLWIQQGVSQTTLFLRQWRKNNQGGKLSCIALAWFQVQAGVSFPILGNPDRTLPQLESKWFESLRTFLATIRANIVIEDFVTPALQRLHDFVIMDAVQASGLFSDAEIRRINYCRLYLQAETVSDIFTESGKCLDPSKLKGEWSLHSSRRHGNFIYQERPEGAAWSLWKKRTNYGAIALVN